MSKKQPVIMKCPNCKLEVPNETKKCHNCSEMITSSSDYIDNYLEENKNESLKTEVRNSKLGVGALAGFILSSMLYLLVAYHITDAMGLTDHAKLNEAEKQASYLTGLGNSYSDSQLLVKYAKRELPDTHNTTTQVAVSLIAILIAAIIYKLASDEFVRQSILTARGNKLFKEKYKQG